MSLILSHLGLTADRVRQLCPPAPRPAAPQVKRRGNGHEVLTALGTVDAWLEKAQSGDRCDRNTFNMSRYSAHGVFKAKVTAKQLRLVRAATRGRHGVPAIYEKV